ncbi:odr-3, partial [Symbiodinium microadriaticum]
AGDSGKSTIFKQMRLLYGTPYTEEEKISFRIFILQNCVETIEQLCVAAREAFPNDSMIHSDSFQLLCPSDSPIDQFRKFPEFTEAYVRAIRSVWRSPLMDEVWLGRSSLQISDTSALFLDRIDEISSPQYQPSESDIIYARIRTTEIREDNLQIDDQIFQFIDVGGQRNERRKWINCFEGVHGVMFVAALSEFDQTLFEENSVNRMVEALDLFQQTVNETAFVKSAMILFLNKRDLFDEKIKRVDIASIPAFSDYAGPANDRDAGIAYFVDKFVQRNETHQE